MLEDEAERLLERARKMRQEVAALEGKTIEQVEDFILKGRNVRADVHQWLSAKLPRHSRLN